MRGHQCGYAVMSKPCKLRIGVIGTGAFAEACHLPGLLSHPQAEVVATCGGQRARTQAIADRFGIPLVMSDPAELCSCESVDAVTICTPTVRHQDHALLALEHGNHVFCEKPLASAVSDAEKMTSAARTSGRVHQVAFTFRHLYGIEELLRRVKAGDVGEPCFVRIHHEYLDVPGSGPPGGWRYLHGSAGGVLYETGAHLFDLVHLILGPVMAVKADRRFLSRPGVATEDVAMVSFRCMSGAGGQLFASRVTTPRTPNHVQVAGREGVLEALISRGSHDALRRARAGDGAWEDIPLPKEARDGAPHALGRMMRTFVDGCLRGSLVEGAASFDDGLGVQQSIAAAEESCDAGWHSLPRHDLHGLQPRSAPVDGLRL